MLCFDVSGNDTSKGIWRKKMWGEMMMMVNITSEWAFVEGCLLIPNGNVYRRAGEFKGNVYRRASDYSTIVDKKK